MKSDVIIIGGGEGDALLGMELLSKGRSCILICPGRISEDTFREEFRTKGGILLLSDSVRKVNWASDTMVESLNTENLGSTVLSADKYVLCSGRFFSRGLTSDMNGIYEPVFGLDVKYDPDRSKWCAEDFFAVQPFEKFGVQSIEGKAVKNGRAVENLYVCGDILCDGQDNKEWICKII